MLLSPPSPSSGPLPYKLFLTNCPSDFRSLPSLDTFRPFCYSRSYSTADPLTSALGPRINTVPRILALNAWASLHTCATSVSTAHPSNVCSPCRDAGSTYVTSTSTTCPPACAACCCCSALACSALASKMTSSVPCCLLHGESRRQIPPHFY